VPYPKEYGNLEINLQQLNYFKVEDRWLNRRIKGLDSEIDRILAINEDYDPKIKKIKCSRYVPSLSKIPIKNRKELNELLLQYRDFLRKAR